MNKSDEEEGEAFAAFIRSLPVEKRNSIMEQQRSEALHDHKEFQAKFRQGECSLCGEALTHFNEREPCPHWLLMPKGFRKKHLPKLVSQFGLARTEAYLRWVASEDGRLRHIADSSEESDTAIVATTIRYQDFEWSFSCSESDLRGHPNSKSAHHPHFHFQMRAHGRSFINYNDFHLPLTKQEVSEYWAIAKDPGLRRWWLGGESVDDLLKTVDAKTIVERSISVNDPAVAPINIQTIIMAEPGSTISGDDISNIYAEARQKGVTVASLAHKLTGARTQSIISAGPGAVDPAPRSNPRGKKE